MTNTEAWIKTLAVMCNCYPDTVGNMPCDNGYVCDKCSAKEVQEFYNKIKEKTKMIIKRTINGTDVEIELTHAEILKAYWEQEDKYTAEDIQSRYSVPNERIDEVVESFRASIEHNDYYWEAYWTTLEDVCKEMGFEEVEDEE